MSFDRNESLIVRVTVSVPQQQMVKLLYGALPLPAKTRSRRPFLWAHLTSDILSGSGVQQQSNNQTVQTQDFSENQDQKHTHEQSWLLGVTSDTSVTDDTNGKTSSQTGQTDGQTSTQLDETSVQGLDLLQGVSDQDGHNQTVNGNDTGQNNWHNTLKQQVWSQHKGGTHTNTGLGGTVRGTETGEDDGGGTTDGTEERSVDWTQIRHSGESD